MSTINSHMFKALKTALKSRGLTYKDVAHKVGVSEKTIKRLFKNQDCSVSRLNLICDSINLSLYDLIDFSQQYQEPLSVLTKRQETFLVKNRAYFYFLFLLTTGYTAKQIQKKYHLSEKSLSEYLLNLDQNGFIELGADNQYRLMVKGKLLLTLHGPLHAIIRDLNIKFIKYVIDHEKRPDVFFNGFYRYMSMDTFKDFCQDIRQISEQYLKKSDRDEAILSKKNLIGVKWAAALGGFEIFGIWPIEEMSNL